MSDRACTNPKHAQMGEHERIVVGRKGRCCDHPDCTGDHGPTPYSIRCPAANRRQAVYTRERYESDPAYRETEINRKATWRRSLSGVLYSIKYEASRRGNR